MRDNIFIRFQTVKLLITKVEDNKLGSSMSTSFGKTGNLANLLRWSKRSIDKNCSISNWDLSTSVTLGVLI
jgi:hypothetical protein